MLYLMWYDEAKKPLEAKLADAVAAFRLHYNGTPNTARVNDVEGASLPATVAGMRIECKPTIQKNNVWVGVE